MACCWIVDVCGYFLMCFLLYRFFRSVYHTFYPYVFASPIKDLVKFCGADWAVVTGSTDGIGKAYATELAKRGFNLVLISRSQDKLDLTKQEIAELVKSELPDIKIHTIVYDFVDASVEHYRTLIGEKLEGLNIGILVNNVGMSLEYPERFASVAGGLERLAGVTTINTLPVTILTAMVLPGMVERKKGVVINMSSAAADYEMLLWSVYSASKKYVNWLTSILRTEYATSGVVFQTVTPMLVATKMAQIKQSSFIAPSPADFAKQAVNTIGIDHDTYGCLSHQIQGEIGKWIPPFILMPILNSQSSTIRNKALKRKERNAKKE